MRRTLVVPSLCLLTACSLLERPPTLVRPARGSEVIATGAPASEPSAPSWIADRLGLSRADEYPLDAIDRHVEQPGGKVECSDEALVDYAGTSIPYAGAVKVDPAFRERLMRFEDVAKAVATDVYGRPPARIRHLGTFSCRASRNRSYRLSEHALGNAIDLAGFDFAPAAKDQPLPGGAPAALRRAFEVRVVRHWNAPRTPESAVHARFLAELTRALGERSDVFRGMIGPSHPGHHDHLHFDMAPWRFVHL